MADKTASKPAAPAAPAAPVAAPAATASGRVAPIFTAARTDIPMPTRTSNRGGKNIYPFDSLTVPGASFGVQNKTAKQLSTVISNQNAKHKTQTLDPATSKPVDTWSKKFFVVPTDPATDPEGATARVFREI